MRFAYVENQYPLANNQISVLAAEVPSELIEDSKFVPLKADDPIFGPPVSSG